MDERHQKMFNEQLWYSENVVSNYFGKPDYSGNTVFEIGCAEGGGLHFFSKKGACCFGLEYSLSRYQNSLESIRGKNLNYLHGDILRPETFIDTIPNQFDFIIIRDVIEHLHDKRLALQIMFDLLGNDGKLFLSFPPKYSPYAGHQQITRNKLGRLPYLYLLPQFLYTAYLKLLSQPIDSIFGLIEVRKLRISLFEFENIIKDVGFKCFSIDYYLIRPCYEKRFKWRRIRNPFSDIPLIREITTLGAIYLLTK